MHGRKVAETGRMNPSPEAQAVPQSLRILGISRIEEAIYRRLLRALGSTADWACCR